MAINVTAKAIRTYNFAAACHFKTKVLDKSSPLRLAHILEIPHKLSTQTRNLIM